MDADHTAIILTSLNRLFENSQYLDDDAFIDFISALCRLNAEYSGVPYNNGEQESNNKSSRAVIIFIIVLLYILKKIEKENNYFIVIVFYIQ